MNRYLPDTSCLIALLSEWHEHHEATWKYMDNRRRAGVRIVLAAHCLLETYSVLTRMPAPYRLTERDAFQLLESNFKNVEIVALHSAGYWNLLGAGRDLQISGGQIYDGLIAACAKKAKVTVLLTWNVDHFSHFQDKTLQVKTPT